jgi:hypothetical protein
MSHEISSYGIDFYNKTSIGLSIGNKISFLFSVGTEVQKEMTGSDYHFFPTINAGIVF